MSEDKISRTALPVLPDYFDPPGYDLLGVSHGIVHIGLGGFHRAHMARYAHDLMSVDRDGMRWGIIGAGLRDSDRPLLRALAAQDGLYCLNERGPEGDAAVLIGSIVAVIDASERSAELLAVIDDPRTRIVSVTVSENGYHLDRATGNLDLAHPLIAADLACRQDPRTMPGILVEAFRRRRDAEAPAFTALSCDNIQHNGDVLRRIVLAFAERCDPALAEWIGDQAGFPNAMVDRITPVPTQGEIDAFAARTGVPDRASLTSESFRQWVLEDSFVAGRPAWDRVGAQFVDDVEPYEFMKLRLLNASHLAIAGIGQLCGYLLISDAVADPLLRRYMRALMERETGPTLKPVPGIDLATYQRTLIDRFSNTAIRDTTQRVNTDAPVSVLVEPIRDRLAAGEPIELLALGLAAWCRRVAGRLDDATTIAIVHPLAELLAVRAREGREDATPLLSITTLFGELGQDRRLVSATNAWLGPIYRNGMKATLADAVARGRF